MSLLPAREIPNVEGRLPGLEGRPPASVWAGVSTHNELWPMLRYGISQFCNRPLTHVTINFYDGKKPSEQPASCATFSQIRGPKPMFWLETFTVSQASAYDYIFLFDDDMIAWPPAFTLDDTIGVMASTGAMVAQPRVAPRRQPPNGTDEKLARFRFRSTDHPELRAEPPNGGCAVRQVDHVEVMAPMFTSAAWRITYNEVLRLLPTEVANDTNWGTCTELKLVCLEHIYCAAIAVREPRRPSCVVGWHTIFHLNWRSIELQGAARKPMLKKSHPVVAAYRENMKRLARAKAAAAAAAAATAVATGATSGGLAGGDSGSTAAAVVRDPRFKTCWTLEELAYGGEAAAAASVHDLALAFAAGTMRNWAKTEEKDVELLEELDIAAENEQGGDGGSPPAVIEVRST